jgi:hypothetical protein
MEERIYETETRENVKKKINHGGPNFSSLGPRITFFHPAQGSKNPFLHYYWKLTGNICYF